MTTFVHFEITAADVEAIAGFYAEALGLVATPSPFLPGYALLGNAAGPLGAVMDRKFQSQSTIVWFGVEDIEASLAAIVAAGGRQAGDINAIPGQGRLAYASDPNGTIFGLKQAENR